MAKPTTLYLSATALALVWAAVPAVSQQRPNAESQPRSGEEQQMQDGSSRENTREGRQPECGALPDHARLTEALRGVVTPRDPSGNGGLGNHMWAVVVDRGGTVCTVTRSGRAAGDQWPGSRGIAAAKANTANAFSLPGFALSTANLYFPSQPGQPLFGLEAANPADPRALAAGSPSEWGTDNDPLIGQRPGGVVVFGGGLALYTAEGRLVGALGVSGDRSCTDHVIAWKLRSQLDLDHVPKGNSRDTDDNIIYDITTDPATGEKKSASGFGHPECEAAATSIAENFSETYPTGAEKP